MRALRSERRSAASLRSSESVYSSKSSSRSSSSSSAFHAAVPPSSSPALTNRVRELSSLVSWRSWTKSILILRSRLRSASSRSSSRISRHRRNAFFRSASVVSTRYAGLLTMSLSASSHSMAPVTPEASRSAWN